MKIRINRKVLVEELLRPFVKFTDQVQFRLRLGRNGGYQMYGFCYGEVQALLAMVSVEVEKEESDGDIDTFNPVIDVSKMIIPLVRIAEDEIDLRIDSTKVRYADDQYRFDLPLSAFQTGTSSNMSVDDLLSMKDEGEFTLTKKTIDDLRAAMGFSDSDRIEFAYENGRVEVNVADPSASFKRSMTVVAETEEDQPTFVAFSVPKQVVEMLPRREVRVRVCRTETGNRCFQFISTGTNFLRIYFSGELADETD